jgi:arabinose-5-phosphate isomerase
MSTTKADIQKTALEVIEKELLAVTALRQSIDGSFLKIVEILYTSKGRLIVTGIGKSALIGQKIVATLNSTGTPAIFMHAADAIHGDLGSVQPEILSCAFLKRGHGRDQSPVPLIRKMGNLLIGMVGNRESYLGRSADYVLLLSAPHEACPNDLAPTASTTVQMVLGDALAVCLLQLRGFSQEDFARFHPGGSLGKKLYLRVCDIMDHNLLPKVLPGESIRDTIFEISRNRLGATAVLDQSGKLQGIITDGDVRRMVEKNNRFENLCASDVMTREPKTVLYDQLAVHAYEMMQSNKITQLIVLRENRYAGMVHIHDIIREGIV